MLDTQRALVEKGYHPSIAGALVRRAYGRMCRNGFR
jgi:hypothetical protein